MSNSKAVSMVTESNRWSVVDQDGVMVILKRIGSDQLVLVEHDGVRWICTSCGDQPTRVGLTCPHVMAATKDLPRAEAVRIASRIARPRKARPEKAPKVFAQDKATVGPSSALNAGQRFKTRDEDFRRITSEVTVRPMTDEDRQRLAERRKRKRISSD